MILATVRHEGRLTGARVEGDRVVLLDAANAVAAAVHGGTEWGEIDASTAHYARTSPDPQHILCIGLNYRSHLEQLGRPMPEYPTFFAKFPSTLTGPRDSIVLPAISDQVQGEVELGVVVGATVHRADLDRASAAIAGFTVANDLSMRDWQHRTSEALQGKVFDRSTPVGPYLVSPGDVDGGRGLELSFRVDGTLWQTGSTADMLFSPAELVSYCSQFLTLRPGDVILTGTPGTTPAAGDLHPGSVLETAIEGLGVSINPVVSEEVGHD
ncbi:MAG: fumarylacetoacetate hydrolase family protein [Aeromicrobium sp.]